MKWVPSYLRSDPHINVQWYWWMVYNDPREFWRPRECDVIAGQLSSEGVLELLRKYL